MQNFWLKMDTGLLIALLALGLEFYRQFLKANKDRKTEISRQIQEAKQSTKERTGIQKDIGFVKEKIEFLLDWISKNSQFR